MSPRALRSLVATTLIVLSFASAAPALDQDSLRLRKLPPDVELSWTDPTPTMACIFRDAAGPVVTLLGQSAGLTFLDVAPPGVLVLYYQVDEPPSGICGPPPAACAPVGVIACGASVAAANTDAGSTDRIDAYACGVADATGPEIAWTFAAIAGGSITASLSGLAADLDVFVIEERGGGCDPADCIAGGADSIGWTAVAGTTYHIVVDGRSGATSSFVLTLACSPPPPPTCASAGVLACGAAQNGRNDGVGSADLVDAWGGCGGRDASGPEMVYSFTATDSGATTATLSGAPAGLDVYVLADQGAGCDPAACIAFGNTSASFAATSGATYYVVVDGFSGAMGAFTLTMACPMPTTCAPAGTIGCGGAVAGDTAGAGTSSVLADYPACFAAGMEGREQLHELVATANDTLTAQIANAPAGLDVFVLRDDGAGCEAATCLTSGDTTAMFQATAGQRYWIVVDAPSGVSGTYDLGLACAAAECDPDAILLCGDAFAHNNAWPVFTDVNDTYPCTPLDMSGPEYAFRFTATQSGQATAALSNMTGELDVLILDGTLGCSAAACTAWGDTSVDFAIASGRTYDVVVDGRSGAEGFFRLDLTCIVPPATCDPHGVIRCGDLVGNDSAAGRDVVDSWPCAPGRGTSGEEYVFQFVPTEDATVRVVMDMNTEDLDLFVVQDGGAGCQPSGCIATGDTEVTFDAVAGRVYYVLVDGRSGASDIFRLWMDCQRLPGRCRPGGPIGCGQTLSGRNDAGGSTDAIDQYPTCVPYPEGGPEYTYEFVAAATGTLRATISNLTADLDIVVLHDTGGGCIEPACVAIGNMTVDVPVTAGQRYFVVVEGFAGNVGGYDLAVECL